MQTRYFQQLKSNELQHIKHQKNKGSPFRNTTVRKIELVGRAITQKSFRSKSEHAQYVGLNVKP